MAHIDVVREHFSVVNHWIYMDHAAVSPLTRDMVYGLSMRADDIMESGAANSSEWKEDIIQVRLMYAQLIGSLPDEVAFIDRTCDGVNLVANGIDWKKGDNVVLTKDDYPANVYPWMNQQPHGVEIKWVSPHQDGRILIEDIAAAIDDRTRVVAVSFVQFTTGFRLDLAALGAICEEKGVFFFVDAIQGLGVLDMDVRAMKISAMAAHSKKWLLCPGGIGLLYVSRNVLKDIRVTNPGAGSVINASNYTDYDMTWPDSAQRFEASSFNPMSMSAIRAGLAMFTGLSMGYIENRVISLTDALCKGLTKKGYDLHTPRGDNEKSGIVVFSSKTENIDALSQTLKENRVKHTKRFNKLRFSPHFYNTHEEVQKVLKML